METTRTSIYFPIKAAVPRLDLVKITWGNRRFSLPYVYRKGNGGPAVHFVHGLGGAKENFYAAFQSPALADCTLLAFDLPGTGLADFDPDDGLDVSGLADIARSVAGGLLSEPYFLAGASMGGLISLLQIRRHGSQNIRGFINLEGNLCAEDCMFSRQVVSQKAETFAAAFDRMAHQLRLSHRVGDQLIAQNMAMNVDIRAYYSYSFQTVAESDSGRLIEEFLALRLPALFLYGDANSGLTYLPRLRESAVEIQTIVDSGHFLFYDNPVDTFQAIGDFVHRHSATIG